MVNKSSKLRQLNTLGLTALVLLGPFALYYVFYFSAQKSYFTSRDFRLLAVLSKQIEMKVDGTAGAFEKAAASASKSYQLSKDRKDFRIDSFLQPIIGDGTNIEALPVAPKLLSGASLAKATVEKPSLALNVKQEDGGSSLYFAYTGYEDAGKQLYQLPMQAKIKFAELIGPFVHKLANHKDFDSVLLVQEDGKVIFEECPAELGLTNVNSLVDKDHKKIDFDLLKQNSNVLDVELAQTKYKLFIQPVQLSFSQTDSDNAQGARWIVCGLVHSDHFLSESAGISYTILIIFTFLCVIVMLSAPFLKLLFMGAREKLRVADVYFLTFSALMGSALATLFLVYVISYSNLEDKMEDDLESLSTAIATNFDLELRDANRQLAALNNNPDLLRRIMILRALDKLDKAGKESSKRSPAEAAKAATERRELTQELEELDKIDREEATGSHDDQGLKNYYDCAPRKRCSGRTKILADLASNDPDYYPYFSTAIWMDNDGQQRIKWTTESDLPSFIPVKTRPYFQGIVNGRTWDYKEGEETIKFLLEPVYSMSTGGQQVILSTEAPLTDSKSKTDKWVSALAIRPLSLLQTVLPADLGYGYCVVDNDGNVLFHSDASRNLLENFFQESDNDGHLRSAVLANETKGLNSRYQGVDHRLFVRPLPHTPWSLITFRDRQVLRTAALELITCSLCIFVAYVSVLSLLLVCWLIYVRRRQSGGSLVWPNWKRASNYYFSIVVNLVLAIGLMIGIFVASKWTVLALTIVLPLIAFLFQRYNSRIGLKRPAGAATEERPTRFYQFGYVFSLVTLLLLVSVLPMLAFFKFAYDREMTFFVRLGQINFARGLEDRALRVQEQYSRSDPRRWASDWQKDPEKLEHFIEARLKRGIDGVDNQSFSDVYSQFFFNTILTMEKKNGDLKAAEHPADTFGTWLDRLLPLNNTISLRIRGGVNGVPGDDKSDLLTRVPDSHGKLNWFADGKLDGDDDYEVLVESSNAPALGKQQGPYWWIGLFAILATVAWLLHLLIRFIASRIFLLNVEPMTAYGDELCEEEVSQNALVLASSFTRKDQLLMRDDFNVVDLRNMKKKGWDFFTNGQKQQAPDHKTIALNYFEYNREDPKINREKVRLLESLLIHNRKVVVVSSVDLTEYRFEENGAAQSNGNGVAENGSSAKLLSSFFRTYIEDKDQLVGFTKKLQELEEVWRRGRRWETQGLKGLHKALKRECEPRACLQRIGENLIAKPYLKTLTPENIISRVQEQANAYYHSIWETCSQDEKITLCYLTKYHLVSARNPDLPRLLRRGLVFKDPNLRPMNESFSRFILAESSPEKLVQWQRSAENSSWETLRIPLFIVLLGAAGFLFVSQRELYNSTLAFVSAFAAGMPSLFKVLGMLQSGRVGGVAG